MKLRKGCSFLIVDVLKSGRNHSCQNVNCIINCETRNKSSNFFACEFFFFDTFAGVISPFIHVIIYLDKYTVAGL